jgi:hypothetical protein
MILLCRSIKVRGETSAPRRAMTPSVARSDRVHWGVSPELRRVGEIETLMYFIGRGSRDDDERWSRQARARRDRGRWRRGRGRGGLGVASGQRDAYEQS